MKSTGEAIHYQGHEGSILKGSVCDEEHESERVEMSKPIVQCALCYGQGPLENSHLYPKFVGRWLKRTSATGRLRLATKANVPVEDLPKKPLLCGACEDRFEKFETQFSKKVFYPYVDQELDRASLKRGVIPSFAYDEWMLKFLISVQWRCMIWDREERDRLTDEELKALDGFQEGARLYLLGQQHDVGGAEMHLMLFQSMAAVDEPIPEEVHENVNAYLLRATDGTVVWATGILGVFTKLGPIGIYSSLVPQHMVDMPDTQIKMKGVLPTEQRYLNAQFNQFLFIDRPNQCFRHYRVSEKQRDKIAALVAKDTNRALSSLSLAAVLGDEHKRQQKKWSE